MLIDSEMDEKIIEFRKWIKIQPHMPQDIGKIIKNFNLKKEMKNIILSFIIFSAKNV